MSAGDTDRDDKTEDPSDRRREETREQGNIPRSADLNAAFLAVAITGAFYFVGSDLSKSLAQMLRMALSQEPWDILHQDMLFTHILTLSGGVVTSVLPLFAVMVFSALAGGAMQAGFHITPTAIQPNWARLNPLSGIGRIFSLQGTMRVVGSILKLLILGTVAYSFLGSLWPQAMRTSQLEVSALASLTGESLMALSFQMALALTILAGLDYGYQYWQFEKNLKMTKQEIRDEMKMMEGDPHIRQRRKEAHKKLVDSRQMAAAKTADVMITNPTEIAVALKYDPAKMDAPIIVAKGVGLLAGRLRQIAAQNGIPIVEKKPLARALYYDVKVGHPVPIELYAAVAEIMAYVIRLKGKQPR